MFHAGPAVEKLNAATIVHGDDGDPASVIEAAIEAEDPGDGLTALAFGGARIYVPAIHGQAGDRIRLRIRARDVALAHSKPHDISVLNILPGRITEITAGGDGHTDVRLDIGGGLWARITRRSANELALRVDQEVYALIKSVAIDRGAGAGT